MSSTGKQAIYLFRWSRLEYAIKTSPQWWAAAIDQEIAKGGTN
jgi:hypothetical protein